MAGGLRKFLRRNLGAGPGGAARQFGAIPWRQSGAGIEFLLITSRRTRRWIFPKGGRIAGLSGAASAAQEAYEEAGVEGQIARGPAGTYHGVKRRDAGNLTIEVEMYPLEVLVELEDWPEKAVRRRRWASLEEACGLLSEPELVRMVRDFAERIQAGPDQD